MPADPRPRKRIVDPKAIVAWRREHPGCVIEGHRCNATVHHVVPKGSGSGGGDDVPENFITLDFVFHDSFHSGLDLAAKRIRTHLTEANIAYVLERKGADWLERTYPTGG